MVIVVTGASSGIGLAAAEAFAQRGHHVALVGRDQARLDEALARVRASGGDAAAFRADFAVLDEVRALGERLAAEYPSIDVLANNAGGLVPRRSTTVDGFETTIQTNHLASFLLSNLLRDRLAGGRMVVTASGAHQAGRLDPADLSMQEQRYLPFRAYGNAKQANILFAAEAARRWPDVFATSYHPGTVRTRFGNESPLVAWYIRSAPWLRTAARGADTLVWLATEPTSTLVDGGYYMDRRLRTPARHAADADAAAKLWNASLAAVGL
ncbi:MAG TPA: SDR family NAD(P)-dependent oxidoreductase [Micromonosporaceae bacterium]|nr:SDR family NAD(P)-dependent oxidoreductase [Micromonosporaceae bacterium]